MVNPIRMLNASSPYGFHGVRKGTLNQFGGLVAGDGASFSSQTNYGFQQDNVTPVWAETASASVDYFNGGLLTGIAWDATTITLTANNGQSFTYDFVGGGLSGATGAAASLQYTVPDASKVLTRVTITANANEACKLITATAVPATYISPLVIGAAAGAIVLIALVGWWYSNRRSKQKLLETQAPPPPQQQQPTSPPPVLPVGRTDWSFPPPLQQAPPWPMR